MDPWIFVDSDNLPHKESLENHLNNVDDYSWECLDLIADTSISGFRETRIVIFLLKVRRKPDSIFCDNGKKIALKLMFCST